MRVIPQDKYIASPTLYTIVGCAYEDLNQTTFPSHIPDIEDDGYVSMKTMDRYIRKHLPIKSAQYCKKDHRVPLESFLRKNNEQCCIFTCGGLVYAKGPVYYSFSIHDDDDIISIWYIGEKQSPAQPHSRLREWLSAMKERHFDAFLVSAKKDDKNSVIL